MLISRSSIYILVVFIYERISAIMDFNEMMYLFRMLFLFKIFSQSSKIFKLDRYRPRHIDLDFKILLLKKLLKSNIKRGIIISTFND